jgi:hypothetical protein
LGTYVDKFQKLYAEHDAERNRKSFLDIVERCSELATLEELELGRTALYSLRNEWLEFIEISRARTAVELEWESRVWPALRNALAA